MVLPLIIAAIAITAVARYLAKERNRPTPNHGMAAAVSLHIVIFLSAGLLVLLAQSETWMTPFFWALISLLSGGIAGMLAALPVTVATDDTKGQHVTVLSNAAGKLNIVLGGGLAFNWQSIYGAGKSLAASIGIAAGGAGKTDPAISGGAILLYFGLVGLIAGLLLTRLFLLKYLDATE